MAQDLVTRLTANNTDLKKKLAESKAKVQELEASVKRLNATQRTNQQTISKLGQAYNRLHKENKLLKQFQSLNSIMPTTCGSFGSLGTMIGKIPPQAIAATAALAGLSKGVSDNVKLNMELDVSLSALKAITGDTTEAMNTYREAAIQMGRTTPQTAS
jgi:chromosome segregation ATPase